MTAAVPLASVPGWLGNTVLLVAYAVAGWRVLWTAARRITRWQFFDENLLMTVASIGAIAVGEISEAVGVMVFYAFGELLQARAVERSRKSIESLMDIRSETANVIRDGRIERVRPESVAPGERILVRPGEGVPLDGAVVEGESFVDTSALTGESMPRAVGPGDRVLAGTINARGVLTVEVSKAYSDSSVARILGLVEKAACRKAKTERFIAAFARYYTPAVVGLAALIAVAPPLVLPGQVFSAWIHRALVLLVISCPCALVISVPLSYFAGIGGASRRGILIKGANFLETLTAVDTVVFDKTGTLTEGSFRVVEVTGTNGFSQGDVLRMAARAGAHSTHPVSASIRRAYTAGGPMRVLDLAAVAECDEIGGCGVRAMLDGVSVIAGNDRMLHREGIPHDICETDGTVVHVASGGALAGRIRVADTVKPGAAETVRRLRSAGVRRLVMLTGDDAHVAEQVAAEVGIPEFHANLLPEDKVAAVEAVMAEPGRPSGSKVAFVGDGINDAPVLTRADVGIAMGALGSDAAIEAADVVIMDDNPGKIADALSVARRTRQIVVQNIVFALGVKGIVMALGAVGLASMWGAVFADVGVALIAVVNATRAFRG